MTLYNCITLARSGDVHGREFMMMLPRGEKKLTFIDPWFGLARIDGVKGVVNIDELDQNTECRIWENT